MTRYIDDFEASYLEAEDRAERRKRALRERDYRETGYLGDCEECGEDNCECHERGCK